MGVLDWINFGLGMASATASVSNARRLEQMQREGAEAAVIQALLSALRDLVFDSRAKLKIIEPLMESDPLPVFAMARTVEWRLTTLGIEPSLFPEFRDKEYVQETLDQLGRIEKGTYGRMTPEQRQQAEDCALALHEMPLLDKAVTSETAREEFKATDSEWSSLTTRKTLFTLGGIVALVAACPACAVGLEVGGDMSIGLAAVGPVLGLVLAGGGVVIFFVGRSPARLKELDQRRASLKAEYADADTQKHIIERFGKQNKQGYLDLRNQRQALIQTTFSSLADDRLLLT